MGTKKFSLEGTLSMKDRTVTAFKSANSNIDAFSKKMKSTTSGMAGMLKSANSGINKVLKVGLTAAFAAVAAGAVAATSAYIEFDKAITGAGAKFKDLSVTSSDYQSHLTELGETARKVAAITEYSATDTAGALDKMAMAGMSSELSMALLAGTTDLATSAGTDLTTAVDIATDSLGAFSMMSDDATTATKNLNRISDVFAKTTTTANTDLTMLFEAVKTGAPTFTKAGQSLETFSSAVGILANSGIKGSEAGTALRNAMIRLAAPTAESAKVLKNLGVKTKDSNGNFRDMYDIIADLNKGLAGYGTAQKTAMLSTVFGSRSVSAMNILLDSGADNLKEYRSQLENSTGAANDMANAIRGSITNQIEVLKSGLTEVGLKFVEAFKKRGSDALQKIIKAVQEFNVEKVIDFFERVIDVATVLFKVLKFLAPGIIAVVAAIKIINAVLAVYAIVQTVANTAMLPVIITIALIGAAIAALAIIITLLIKNWTKVKEVMISVGKTIGNFFVAVWEKLGEVMEKPIAAIKAVGQTILKYMLMPINFVIDAVQTLLGVLSKIPIVGDKIGAANDAIGEFQNKANSFLTGSENPYDLTAPAQSYAQTYASPNTAGGGSITETRSVNEVYVRPDQGASISTKRGGAPRAQLSYGGAQ